MAIPVPYKPLDRQKAIGKLKTRPKEISEQQSGREAQNAKDTHNGTRRPDNEKASPVRWVKSIP